MKAAGTESWEALYAGGRHHSVWPWSDVVSLVMRFARPPANQSNFRVMEIGCGMGANVPFFERLGADYHGLDGSPSAIAHLRRSFPAFADNLFAGDFTKPWAVDGKFDLVLDRAAITHNDLEGIVAAFAEIGRRLKPGGILVSIDLFSTASSEASAGDPGAEKGTRVNFFDGPLAGIGLAHFFDEDELRSLLSGFEILYLQHKVLTTIEPRDNRNLSSWSLVARRP